MKSVISRYGREVYPVVLPIENHSLQSFNFYIIRDNDSITLLDAGLTNEKSLQALQAVLTEQKLNVSNIDRIILTHHHEDHVGLVPYILKEKGVPVYAHPLAVPRLKMDTDFLRMRYTFFEKLYEEMDCSEQGAVRLAKMQDTIQNVKKKELQTDITLIKESDEIAGLRVLGTPGHSPDSICLYDEKRKWLFSGDLFFANSSTNAIIDPDLEGNRLQAVAEYSKSLKRIQQLEADIVFPGHGGLITNHKEVIQAKLDKINRKSKRLYHYIESGISTGNDLAEAYYKQTY
ncbi:MBL fold metallo-hydrolase [Sporosarcina sp. P3]|uniref:MBL fold metallo-hydrolase n=1 Tax=Sporosarcina TaxID=1569 RepID=UPI0009DC6F36|nr:MULTISPECIES: MBL fold metallo-hydrolase [Sporosarcina]ARF16134.1 hypothetical protein SporoP17a_01740 [Sporosarcina ureae]PID20145.1 MBL fold metallo-hydrolase [Sporosarcina sp. P3]